MCHNIVYGRLHVPCGCFVAMSTQKHDCSSPHCVFSTSHPPTCRSRACENMMNCPQQVPIRRSPVNCPDCARDKGERARINALKEAWRTGAAVGAGAGAGAGVGAGGAGAAQQQQGRVPVQAQGGQAQGVQSWSG